MEDLKFTNNQVMAAVLDKLVADSNFLSEQMAEYLTEFDAQINRLQSIKELSDGASDVQPIHIDHMIRTIFDNHRGLSRQKQRFENNEMGANSKIALVKSIYPNCNIVIMCIPNDESSDEQNDQLI